MNELRNVKVKFNAREFIPSMEWADRPVKMYGATITLSIKLDGNGIKDNDLYKDHITFSNNGDK